MLEGASASSPTLTGLGSRSGRATRCRMGRRAGLPSPPLPPDASPPQARPTLHIGQIRPKCQMPLTGTCDAIAALGRVRGYRTLSPSGIEDPRQDVPSDDHEN